METKYVAPVYKTYDNPSNAVLRPNERHHGVYTLTLDTHNAKPIPGIDFSVGTSSAVETDNPTNNVQFDSLPVPAVKSVTQVDLASLELPLSQNIIENEWSRLYFNNGLNLNTLLSDDAENIDLREFAVSLAGETIAVGLLPMTLNPIIAIDTSDAANPIFTTRFPHAIGLAPYYGLWGGEMRVISTPMAPEFTFVNQGLNMNPAYEALSATEFQVTGGGPLTLSGTRFGYLYAPAIATPSNLATLITAALDERFLVTYDPDTNRFSVQCTNLQCGSSLSGSTFTGEMSICQPAICARPRTSSTVRVTEPGDVKIVVPSMNSLPGLMGFTRCTITATPSTCLITAQGQFAGCCQFIKITPGMYNSEDFLKEINLQLNRFWFEPTDACAEAAAGGGEPVPPDNTYSMMFTGSCGLCYVLVIPPGMYNPESLALAMTEGMNFLDPNGDYLVTWNAVTMKFTIASLSLTTEFALEFTNEQNNNSTIHERLGFRLADYRGKKSYTSDTEIVVPITCVGGTTLPQSWQSYTYDVFRITNQLRNVFSLTKPQALPARNTEFVDEGDSTMLVTNNRRAHGYNVDDVVLIICEDGQTGLFRVIEVVDAFSFRIDTGSADMTCTQDIDHKTCVSIVLPPVLNLFLAPTPNTENSIYADILGFPSKTIEWVSDDNVLTAPYPYNLDPPPYVIVEATPVGSDNGTTRAIHQWGSNAKEMLAKVILYPAFRMQFTLPQQITFMNAGATFKHLAMRILNPNRTPYNFHGRHWSATLLITCIEGTVDGGCF